MITCLETVACEVCGSADSDFLYSKKDKFQIEDTAFQVVACRQCGLTYINPRPPVSEIGKFYPEHYQWKEETGEEAPLGFAAKLEKFYRFHQLGTEIKRMQKNGCKFPAKVLDIGCGTGDRLEFLRQLGCDCSGVELSDQALHAQKHFKLNVYQGQLQDACYEDNSFDIVMMYNVLEHVHKPREVLKEIRRILKPGGTLIVEVPNNECFQAKLFKARWAAVDVPRDLYYYDAKTLTRLLKETGFETQKVVYDTDYWHPPTLVISLFPNLDPQLIWAKDKSYGNTMLSRIFWGFWTLVLAPLAFIENKLGRGALMTCFTRKG